MTMGHPTATTNLLRVAAEGTRVRRAAGRLDEFHESLATALKRAVPFLARRGLPVRVVSATADALPDALETLPRPHYVRPLTVTGPSGHAPGAIAFDGDAVALMLDGLLGGTGDAPPALVSETLSGAQTALVSRVASGVITAFSEVLGKMGVSLASDSAAPMHVKKSRDDGGRDAIPIIVRIEFGTESSRGHVVLALPKDALAERQRVTFAAAPRGPDPRVVDTVHKVELELVAQLGTRRMKLSDLSRLKVGDTLRFPTRIDGDALVRIGDRPLFTGRPTSQNGQIALRVTAKLGP